MSKRKRKEGWIVPAHEKVAMVFGAGSTQAMNTFVQSFLSVYILMVGISPAVAAGVLAALGQRLKELKGGEEDDARQY